MNQSTNNKTAYVTDLKSLQAECTSNFLRLVRLLGDSAAGERIDISLGRDDRSFGCLHLEIESRAPYTTVLRVSQSGVLEALIDSPRMRVHLYHDVRMAEVTDFQRKRHFQGRYRYPNAQMHQPDEKLQLNRFLGEWLDHAIAHGHTADVSPLG
ncbi:DUF1249 domain-containing protein [Halotalea alkalilenta]|uniref:Dehydrogenase n=1 Tax=Halotalea alkalilenta TaxID=376489 RepID=A0A172YDI1_9GAMM|nr:DUF1249 domain-containing protein [Halotalea alkalilenta]ANF57309.1 hypothetical protein A5892_07395 [Halotalea alkalilenta]